VRVNVVRQSHCFLDFSVPVTFPDQQIGDFARIVEIASHQPGRDDGHVLAVEPRPRANEALMPVARLFSLLHRRWSRSQDGEVSNPDPRVVFGRRVRELRIERKLSQEKLAEVAELHRNYVGGIERGEPNVSLLNIVKLAHGLNVRPTRLMEPIR
jgi:DNA-binding XRE family transcriptional regulator